MLTTTSNYLHYEKWTKMQCCPADLIKKAVLVLQNGIASTKPLVSNNPDFTSLLKV